MGCFHSTPGAITNRTATHVGSDAWPSLTVSMGGTQSTPASTILSKNQCNKKTPPKSQPPQINAYQAASSIQTQGNPSASDNNTDNNGEAEAAMKNVGAFWSKVVTFGLERTPTEAYSPFIRQDTLVINDTFMNRWIHSEERRDSCLWLPSRRAVPIRKIIIEANKTLIAKIESLSLHNNPVTTIQGAHKFAKLLYVYGYQCGFEDIPSWIQDLKTLLRIDLSGNRIKVVPSWITKMSCAEMGLDKNQITEIASEMKMRKLILASNTALQMIPSPCSKIRILDIRDCSIRTLPRDLFHHGLEILDISGNKELTYLPILLPTSQLKELDAENCGIKTIHESLLRPGININFKNNKISELPREEVLLYMASGGGFGRHFKLSSYGRIDIELNPLVYPPKHVYDEGSISVQNFLKKYSNSIIDSKDVTIMLIGDQESGKTCLSLLLAGKITSAEDITLEDRTHAFDVQHSSIRGTRLIILDLGGHREYESSLVILCRDNGLHTLLLNPAHFDSEEMLAAVALPWIEKVLEGTISPHFKIVVSKMDTILDGEKEGQKDLMKQKLEKLVYTHMSELKETRERREAQLKVELQDKSLTHEKRKRTEAKLSKQIYKVKNMPNFNLDCISFISSLSHDGFEQLEMNLLKSISRLPMVGLQKHWQPTIDMLMNEFHDKPYVQFSELLDKSDLNDDDLAVMLKALNALGKIIWSDDPRRKSIIFHKLKELSIILKSIFYHEMEHIFWLFSALRKLNFALLKAQYSMGQLPLELVECMFYHITRLREKDSERIHIDFSDLQLVSPDEDKSVFTAFLTTLLKCKLVKVMDAKWRDMPMLYVPHLQSGTSLDQDTWIQLHSAENVPFEVGLNFVKETVVHKKTFSSCCIATLSVMERLSSLIGEELEQVPNENTLITRVGSFEVILRHGISYLEGHVVGLRLRNLNPKLLPETVWILLKEIASKLCLDDEDCNLVCLKGDADCKHGDYDPDPYTHGRSLENARKKRGNKCDLKCSFPTQLAIDVMTQLYRSDGKIMSPLSDQSPEEEDNLATRNLLKVIMIRPVDDAPKIKKHPAFENDPYDEVFRYVRPVRQRMDDISNLCQTENGHKKGCQCTPTFVREFTLLETNRAIVTKGNWKSLMEPIFGKYKLDKTEMTGAPCSVAALVRVLRNLVAHAKIQQDPNLWNDLSGAYKWIVMHCFAVGVHFSTHPDPTLQLFADEFMAYEATACQTVVGDRLDQQSCQPLLHVIVFHDCDLGNKKSETAFFTNAMTAENQADFLRSEVTQKLPVDVDLPLVLTYEGESSSAEAASKTEVAPILKTPDCLTSLGLDTQLTHLVHVKAKWAIQVEIDTPGDLARLETTFHSSDKVEIIQKFVQDETHLDHIVLYCDKQYLHADSYLGNVCLEGPCKLFATHDADKLRQDVYFNKQRVEPVELFSEEEDLGLSWLVS